VSTVPFVLVASAKTPVTNARQLIAHAKAHPGKLNSGAANGTPPHLACEQFKRAAAIDIVHVPYKSMSQALADLVSGEVQIVCEATTVLLPLIQGGQAKPLAVMSATRLPELPDVPTMAELGIHDLVVTVWAGVVAPAETPASIVDRLNAEISAGVRSAEVRAGLARLGASPKTSSPQEFATFLSSEVNRWGDTVRSIGLKAD
jgi:tripartite-type tricarboxylate transporter receptor subunit TctC